MVVPLRGKFMHKHLIRSLLSKSLSQKKSFGHIGANTSVHHKISHINDRSDQCSSLNKFHSALSFSEKACYDRGIYCREAAEALKARNIPAQGKQRRRRAPPWVTRQYDSCSSAPLAPVGEADWGPRGNGTYSSIPCCALPMVILVAHPGYFPPPRKTNQSPTPASPEEIRR